MGAEITIVMAKGEKKRFLKNLKSKEIPYPNDNNVGCYVENRGGSSIDICYQMGAMHREWATAISHAICQKYRVMRGGWPSSGSLEKIDQFSQYLPFDMDIDSSQKWFDRYKEEYPEEAKIYEVEIINYSKMRDEFVQAAKLII